MGVNNISHYNYSHTATPIHHQPFSNPPSLSSSLHFPSVFTPNLFSVPSLWLDYTFYFILSDSLSLFYLSSVKYIFPFLTIEIKLLVSALRSEAWVGWSESVLHRRNMKLWKLEKNTTNDCTSAFHLECCLNAATTANSNNNLGKFLLAFYCRLWER